MIRLVRQARCQTERGRATLALMVGVGEWMAMHPHESQCMRGRGAAHHVRERVAGFCKSLPNQLNPWIPLSHFNHAGSSDSELWTASLISTGQRVLRIGHPMARQSRTRASGVTLGRERPRTAIQAQPGSGRVAAGAASPRGARPWAPPPPRAAPRLHAARRSARTRARAPR